MATRSRSRSTLRPSLRQSSSERSNRFAKSSSSSRNVSPANGNRRVAKLNMYLARRDSQDQLNQSALAVPPEPSLYAEIRNTNIKRWDGHQRTTSIWNSLRRDPELWLMDGDCLVHLYEQGHSRRGASLRLSLKDIEACNCDHMLDRFLTEITTSTSSRDSDQFGDFQAPAKYEMYIPAPTHLSREEAFSYHLTTRNFFAWMFDKPVVGERLGDSLLDLHETLTEFRPDNKYNQDHLLAYIDAQGYTDFRDCCDHALAVLRLSEKLELSALWTDAFVHCAGMWETIDTSPEFQYVSRSSQALISRAHLEMDLRMESAGASLSNFLEDDLSGAYIGLGKQAHLHLERFRSFLHTYYIGSYGYWPPSESAHSRSMPKNVYRSMYLEFRHLYTYLVDTSSGTAIQDNKPVDGGICVFQNILSYDKRNKYASLPNPLPLIPKLPAQLSHHKSLGRLLGKQQFKHERRLRAVEALSAATNGLNEEVMRCRLVREYQYFEKSWTMREESTVSCADARKVRWILVYAILQILISVTRAPKEVRDTEGVSYPLCCQVAGTPPWENGAMPRKTKPILQPLRTSLRDSIIELGPDMDIISARPSPLNVPQKSHTIPLPRKISITSNLFVKSPQPIRVASWEVLNRGSPDVSPIDMYNQSPISHNSVSPISQHTAPTTPSASDSSGRGGWSASSSEDGMDHHSVNGSDSNYGDDEDDGSPAPKSSAKPPIPARKRPSQISFRPGNGNPEVEAYIRS